MCFGHDHNTIRLNVLLCVLESGYLKEPDIMSKYHLVVYFVGYVVRKSAKKNYLKNVLGRHDTENCQKFMKSKLFGEICDSVNLDAGYLRRKVKEVKR